MRYVQIFPLKSIYGLNVIFTRTKKKWNKKWYKSKIPQSQNNKNGLVNRELIENGIHSNGIDWRHNRTRAHLPLKIAWMHLLTLCFANCMNWIVSFFDSIEILSTKLANEANIFFHLRIYEISSVYWKFGAMKWIQNQRSLIFQGLNKILFTSCTSEWVCYSLLCIFFKTVDWSPATNNIQTNQV